MNLEKKKALAARTLEVGKGRITFNVHRLNEVKEAITKQDIKDLVADKVIIIKEIKGRAKVVRRKSRRRAGSIRKKIKGGKREYMILTRNLRRHIAQLRREGKLSQEKYIVLRKEIRAKIFRDRNHIKERISQF